MRSGAIPAFFCFVGGHRRFTFGASASATLGLAGDMKGAVSHGAADLRIGDSVAVQRLCISPLSRRARYAPPPSVSCAGLALLGRRHVRAVKEGLVARNPEVLGGGSSCRCRCRRALVLAPRISFIASQNLLHRRNEEGSRASGMCQRSRNVQPANMCY